MYIYDAAHTYTLTSRMGFSYLCFSAIEIIRLENDTELIQKRNMYN
jgi:hypothetical protein